MPRKKQTEQIRPLADLLCTLLRFTVKPPKGCGPRKIIEMFYDHEGGYDGIPAKPVVIRLGTETVVVKPQQLMELGAVLIALAGIEGIDFGAADTVLDEFSLKGKEAATKLAAELSE